MQFTIQDLVNNPLRCDFWQIVFAFFVVSRMELFLTIAVSEIFDLMSKK